MKNIKIYSLLLFLFSLIAFACSKEDGEVNPTASISSKLVPADVNIGGFGISCLRQNGAQWSFNIGAGARHGLSNLQIELLECPAPGTTVVLGNEVTITDAWIMIDGQSYSLTPTYNNDGSCIGIKGSDFTSFVKFEFPGNLDELVKKFGGTLYFRLSDASLLLYGANIIVKTGGKDNKCYKGSILNCYGCQTPPPPVDNCSYSQGRFFNPGNDGKHWPEGITSVTVGNKTVNVNEMTLPATNAIDRAFFQAATLILSSTNIAALPTEVKDAFYYIVAYFSGLNNGNQLQTKAGIIGDWIDKNHC